MVWVKLLPFSLLHQHHLRRYEDLPVLLNCRSITGQSHERCRGSAATGYVNQKPQAGLHHGAFLGRDGMASRQVGDGQ